MAAKAVVGKDRSDFTVKINGRAGGRPSYGSDRAERNAPGETEEKGCEGKKAGTWGGSEQAHGVKMGLREQQ